MSPQKSKISIFNYFYIKENALEKIYFQNETIYGERKLFCLSYKRMCVVGSNIKCVWKKGKVIRLEQTSGTQACTFQEKLFFVNEKDFLLLFIISLGMYCLIWFLLIKKWDRTNINVCSISFLFSLYFRKKNDDLRVYVNKSISITVFIIVVIIIIYEIINLLENSNN